MSLLKLAEGRMYWLTNTGAVGPMQKQFMLKDRPPQSLRRLKFNYGRLEGRFIRAAKLIVCGGRSACRPPAVNGQSCSGHARGCV